MELIHGGDIYTAALAEGKPLLDFSANVNPLGLPPGVAQAAAEAISDSCCYPDPLCRSLRKALAEAEGVSRERIVCGNGAADLIFRLVQWKKPKKALLLVPTFSEYEKALTQSGCRVRYYNLEPDEFQVTETLLEALTPDLDMIFFCNPNNPTGRTVSPGLYHRIAERCGENNILLVADECFNDLLDDPAANTLKRKLSPEVEESDDLIILKAFTKTYAMAGFRLGYALCGSRRMAGGIMETGQPWSVSSLAQQAGIQALTETAYLEEARGMIRRERGRLREAMSSLGITVLSGEANYLFFKIARDNLFYNSQHLYDLLLKRGILIRSCENYGGLSQEYFRIAVRRPAENDRLLDALADLKRTGADLKKAKEDDKTSGKE